MPPIIGSGSYSATRRPIRPAATAAATPAGVEPYTTTSYGGAVAVTAVAAAQAAAAAARERARAIVEE
jgi:hypothetical protein